MVVMKLCICDRGNPNDHLNNLYPKDGMICCSNCGGVLMCDFGEQPHAATIVMINSYACWDHVKEAKLKAEEEARHT